MECHYLQHVRFETPGAILDWAKARGFAITGTRWFLDERPPVDPPDLLIVMGGPMGVYDEEQYPWLAEEKLYLRKALERGSKIVGICLGAQLLAEVLEAAVTKNPHREIGWWPIKLTPEALGHPLWEGFPPEFIVFHWHGDTFEIPKGALHLASSEACTNQAFLYQDQALALQFHMEVTPEGVAALLENSKEDLEPGPFVQEESEILGDHELYQQNHRYLFELLDHFVRL